MVKGMVEWHGGVSVVCRQGTNVFGMEDPNVSKTGPLMGGGLQFHLSLTWALDVIPKTSLSVIRTNGENVMSHYFFEPAFERTGGQILL
jgi:hypothetical protein